MTSLAIIIAVTSADDKLSVNHGFAQFAMTQMKVFLVRNISKLRMRSQ